MFIAFLSLCNISLRRGGGVMSVQTVSVLRNVDVTPVAFGVPLHEWVQLLRRSVLGVSTMTRSVALLMALGGSWVPFVK